jgi:hypothetical protein
VAQRDWVEWHRDYDDPGSLLSRRGELVQRHLRAELDRAPAGGIRLISLCAGQGRDVTGALVLWTRHRRPPDLTPAVRSWFGEAGFREEAFDTSRDGFMSAGAHRLAGEPAAQVPGRRLFTFVELS